ncbi:MAG: adenylate/guanylate cyclase [uncultured bacterium]|nr:MAG: adenylate/guanylate cyclase [uncultured bacterium]
MEDNNVNLSKEQLEKLLQLAGVDLPKDEDPQAVTRALIELEKKLSPAQCAKSEVELTHIPSVLIVDDLELSIYQLSLLLTKSGYNVYIARNFEEAKDQYKKRHYQYVLLDLFMPEPEDGLTLLETFNAAEKTKRDSTKIIVISGTDDKRLISECFVKGANEFIEKTPEWHKNILRHIRLLESQKHGNNMEIVSNIEEKERKIVSIEVNNLHRDYVAQELEKELLTHINSGYYNVIIDMKNVFNITSKGINTLISGFKICSENGGEFKLCNVRTSVNEALSYIFLDNALQIHKDKESALNSFNDI